MLLKGFESLNTGGLFESGFDLHITVLMCIIINKLTDDTPALN